MEGREVMADLTQKEEEEKGREKEEREDEEEEKGGLGSSAAANVCAAMASIMSGLSVRVNVAGMPSHGLSYSMSEKKPVHGQVARLRKEDQQLMEDVCTDACGCCCFCSAGGAGAGGCAGSVTSPCRRRLLHHISAINHDYYRTPHLDIPLGNTGDVDVNHQSTTCSSSSSGCGVSSNVSTPRASTPSPLGIRTRSWSTAAADAAWDSAASISRTISNSF